MAVVAAPGVTPDGLLSGGLTLIGLFVSNIVIIGLAIYQNRAHNKVQSQTAEKWQAHSEELRDRMDTRWESQFATQAKQSDERLSDIRRQYETQIQWYQDELRRRKDRDDH